LVKRDKRRKKTSPATTEEISRLKNKQADSSIERADQESLTEIEQAINKAYEVRREIERQENLKNDYLRQIAKLEATLEAHLEARGQFDVAWLDNKHQELLAEAEELKKEIGRLKEENKPEKTQTLQAEISVISSDLSQLN
jgi:hypothetical protein